ncbi:MAG: hypothetical protein QF724_02650 [Planctomycetota bacterium]|jgi:hypothetical protein|nr:hypothetical protein [Planctomycetota bacterium]MDP6519924.1 hypothetical protein [Planctomycetota bacterium]MDP6837810.1 hypothetical protein [Planctomycetota bacterium]
MRLSLLLLLTLALGACQGSGELGLVAVEARALDWMRAAKPQLNPAVIIELEEVTEAEARSMGLRVFRSVGSFAEGQGWVLDGEELVPIGNCFGGHGLLSVLGADLDGDGVQELLYTASWGSGIHRSEVGVYLPRRGNNGARGGRDLGAADASWRNGDWVLARGNGGTVKLVDVEWGWEYGSYTGGQVIGELRWEGQAGGLGERGAGLPPGLSPDPVSGLGLALGLVLDPGLSPATRGQLWRPGE